MSVSGPLTVGGGADLSLQVAIANQNSLPIESATLIIGYPRGTQSVTEIGKEVFSERQQLNNIGTGEVVNVPIKARMFGEENEEKKVTVAVEYRVAGSNATFYKEATPHTFKISSSPVTLSIDSVKSISSGQEITFNVLVQSNAPTPLTDLLIKATYPEGFDFTEAAPETVSGQNTWRITSLKPGEKKTIEIKGIITGTEDTIEKLSVAAGVANERDAFNLVSPLTVFTQEVKVERPFLDVAVTINGKTDDTVVIDTKGSANVGVSFKNVLDSVIYNGVVKVDLEGNALSEIDVTVQDGHYDSLTNTITWDSVTAPTLEEIAPGQKQEVSFNLVPQSGVGETPEIKVKITVSGQRIFENQAAEQIAGTASRTVKVESVAALTSVALYSEGPFVNSGPVPPIAEHPTQYMYLLRVTNGSNAVSGAEVTAVLPQYMTWLDLVSEDDTVTYNSTTRTMKWSIGDIPSNGYEELWVQVSFLPSLSQVNTEPTILGVQRFKATDRFTGTVIRSESPALTTHLEGDPNPEIQDGRVRKSE